MAKLGPYELNSIVTGDARELAKAIPDESVDLIFTDPVYDRIEDYEWLAETAARILKFGGECLVYYGQYRFYEIVLALGNSLSTRWPLTERLTGNVGRVWPYRMLCYSKTLLWCTKGKPRMSKQNRMDLIVKQNHNNNHKWGKGDSAYQWLFRYSDLDDIIFDPFVGGGSTLAACKQLNRRYLAFEIDPQTAELARQRVANTQPPLPLVYPEQMEIAID